VNVNMAVRRFSRRILAVTGGLVLTLALAAPASARTPVDPGTLNPAPPLNASCSRDESHITCDFAFSDPDIVDQPSGIICGGTELLVSQSRAVVAKRIYHAGGNLLQGHFVESFDGTFRNPDTGRVALWTQHDTVIHDLAVPCDVATGTEHIGGLSTRVWLPKGGTILTDAGHTVVDDATGDVVALSAHHPFDTYYRLGGPSALASLCAALD